jgi:type IV pilus assembly protein PilM
LNKFKFKSRLGIDIQPDGIRIVQLKKKRRDFQVQLAIKLAVPEGVFVEGRIHDWEWVEQTLSAQVDEQGWRGMPVVIGVPDEKVCERRLTLPAGLSEADMESDIAMHIREEMSGFNEPLCMDFSVLSKSTPTSVEVQYAAVRESDLSPYLKSIRAAGLNVKIVDVESYALKRARDLDFSQDFSIALGLALRELPPW